MIGETFALLTVRAFAGRTAGHIMWTCTCACGATVIKRGSHLRKGEVQSCGCLLTSGRAMKRLTHGARRGREFSPEYSSWVNMKQRCFNSKNNRYYLYGARGITVCDRWASSFENFLHDMGQKPTPKHSIDRIDNDQDYQPGNCRWATPLQQRHNRRDKKGETHGRA